MAIKDLQPRQGNVDIVVSVVDVGETREFEKFGKKGRVATAIAKDETGDIKLTLWNDQIDSVKAGDKVHIINGYVSEWQGEKQLTTGKFGKLEVVGESEEVKKEMLAGPDEGKDKEIYEEAKKKIEEAEKLEEEPVTEEEEIE
jgi:replication factor A1